MALFGITLSLDLYGIALIYTSATLAATTTNCLPVITFFLALLLGGVFSEVPNSGVLGPVSSDNCPESDKKTDPATPAPTSESPLQDKASKECAPSKSLSVDESFSPQHEPLTPDFGCNDGSPSESPKGERSVKKQRVEVGYSEAEMVLTHPILESSLSSSYQQPHPLLEQ